MKPSYIVLIVLLGIGVGSFGIQNALWLIFQSNDGSNFMRGVLSTESFWQTTIGLLYYLWAYSFIALLICSSYVFREKIRRLVRKSENS